MNTTQHTATPTIDHADTTAQTLADDRRLQRIEAKLDWLIARIGQGENDETLSTTLDRIEDQTIAAAVASTKRDRLVLEAVEQPAPRQPAHDAPDWQLDDHLYELVLSDALGRGDVPEWSARVIAAGGVLPVTVTDDGDRRA